MGASGIPHAGGWIGFAVGVCPAIVCRAPPAASCPHPGINSDRAPARPKDAMRSAGWVMLLLVVLALAWVGPAAWDRFAAPALPEAPVAVRGQPVADLAPAPDQATSLLELARMPVAEKRMDAARTAPTIAAQEETTAEAPHLLDQLAEWEAPAAAGDPVAACKVSEVLATCRLARKDARPRLEELLETVRQQAIAAPALRDREQGQGMVARLQRQLAWQDRCTELGDDVLALQPYADLRAARAGDGRAATRFVGGRSFAVADLASDPSLGAFFRQHAWSVFEGMLQRGDRAALAHWQDALLLRSDSLLWMVMPEEWKRPELVEALMRRVRQKRVASRPDATAEQPLPPAVEQEAEVLFLRYFDGKPGPTRPPSFAEFDYCETLRPG